MITISYDYKNDRALEIAPIHAVYGEDICFVFKQHDKAAADVSFSSEVVEIKFSNLTNSALLLTSTGTKSTNSATFDVDTSSLPTYGDYKFQFFVTGTYESVPITGTLKLKPQIE